MAWAHDRLADVLRLDPGGADDARETAAFRLLNDYQHGFPLVPRPFERIAAELGICEEDVLRMLRHGLESGAVSRIGAVVAPRRMGASALAALSAPEGRLEAIAGRVSALPEVNHNYQREHDWNLWFVATAPSEARLGEVFAGVERDTGCPVIVLPLLEEFHLDLGFDLTGGVRRRGPRERREPLPGKVRVLDEAERRLMGCLHNGLRLKSRPYAALGADAGLDEGEVCERIGNWLEEGLIRRFGIVVRHHELGFGANAMCVWDVPDEQVGAVGRALAAEAAVTLCYRRRRALPAWRYNLFCMIHGRVREEVRALRDDMAARLGLDRWPAGVLFSARRFKQRGARYLADAGAERAHG